MLDMKFVRENSEVVIDALKKRGAKVGLNEFLDLDKQRREILVKVETLKNQRNVVSQEISRMKKAGENTDNIISRMREVGEEITELDALLRGVKTSLTGILLCLPNIIHVSVPIGTDETNNIEMRKWSNPRIFTKKPLAHWDIGEQLGILDFERGGKVTGARFAFYRGLGSRLERSLISFMLDLHTREHGFIEFFPPFIVNRESMVGTGQLPKFAKDMFKLEGLEYYLIPTAEVPITNYHSQEI